MTGSYIAVDLGGADIRAARCTADGQIRGAIRMVWSQDTKVRAIGVSAPSSLDTWCSIITETFHTPTQLGNDVNLAALATQPSRRP